MGFLLRSFVVVLVVIVVVAAVAVEVIPSFGLLASFVPLLPAPKGSRTAPPRPLPFPVSESKFLTARRCIGSCVAFSRLDPVNTQSHPINPISTSAELLQQKAPHASKRG